MVAGSATVGGLAGYLRKGIETAPAKTAAGASCGSSLFRMSGDRQGGVRLPR